ncbi:hypothetical protein K438DRAFT_1818012 [Mycena galopus ATCC 62051]|nr:hypothetical protein K438DRAFT_1818012 [Mycena galopus ATCC 62051]
MRRHEQLGSLVFEVPWASYASMHTLADASFPLLHSIKFHVPRVSLSDLESASALTMRDAPNLRNVNLSGSLDYYAFPLDLLKIRWGRLETLSVAIQNDKWAESVSTLLLCTNLVALTISADFQEAPAPPRTTGHVTMPLLESLVLDNPFLTELFDHITLPRMRFLHMELSGNTRDLHRMQSLFTRAPCMVQHLILTLGEPDILRDLLALAPLIEHLDLGVESASDSLLGTVVAALRPGVLPSLRDLILQCPKDYMAGRDDLIAMLWGRRGATPRLRSFRLRDAGGRLSSPYISYDELISDGLVVKIDGYVILRLNS